jgi:hypothetical protein
MSRRARPAKSQPREEGVDSLEALLEHLGRLLAEEYVTLLTSTPVDPDQAEEDG